MHTTKTQTAGVRAGPASLARTARTVRPARLQDNSANGAVKSLMSSVCRSPGAVCPQRAARDRVQARSQLFNGLTGKKTDSKTAAPPIINCTVYSQEGVNTTLDLLLSFVGKQQFQVGETVDLSTFKSRPWTRQDKDPKTGKVTTVKLGVIYEGQVDVPQDAVQDIIFLKMKQSACVDKEYVNRIEISKDKDGDGGVINVAANSWIHKSQGGRFFFAKGLALLPSETPDELSLWRTAELEEAKGSTRQSVSTREDWDRIWDYDVYDDLAGYDANTGNIMDRSVLGGSTEYPYPRRIRTGRNRIRGPQGELTYESRDPKSGAFWVPLDERFNTIKDSNFKTYSLLAAIPTVAEAIWRKLDFDKKLSNFKEVNNMYAQLQDPNFTINTKEFVGAMTTKAGRMRDTALKRFGINPDDLPQLQLPGFGAIDLGAVGSSIENIKRLVGGAQNLTDFPPPLVAKNRPGVWDTDEEWGRQALAGVNPSCIKAVTSEADLGGIKPANLEQALEGRSLLALLAASKTEPRLLVIDYTAVFPDYAKKITELGGRYGYSGRAVIYQRNDGQWVPAAIELKGSEGQTNVYTKQDHPNVWRLAKGVFLSLDSGFHQLVTHWLRCHACTEPYIIATNRCLSSLHPVFKLMMPHWRFTPQINANARQSLISAGGIIESTFTPGRYALEMSSKVYGALWTFDSQGLPADLTGRGLAKKENGKLKLLLKDYPYADDGMLIWNAVHEWVGEYLRCYYDDSVAAKSVAGDAEIQNWWEEIKTKGHPDKKSGWPELKTIDDLTEILTTMIWVASAHHAAINFSQYAFTGYFLNRPTICTKAIPQKDTEAYRKLVKDALAGEQAYCDTLSTNDTIKAVLTVELLSTHADNEVYLNDPVHAYILDDKPKKHYDDFVAKINAIEKTIQDRNKDPARKTRNGGTALPYEFLVPSSPQSGITNRGVPQSVSI